MIGVCATSQILGKTEFNKMYPKGIHPKTSNNCADGRDTSMDTGTKDSALLTTVKSVYKIIKVNVHNQAQGIGLKIFSGCASLQCMSRIMSGSWTTWRCKRKLFKPSSIYSSNIHIEMGCINTILLTQLSHGRDGIYLHKSFYQAVCMQVFIHEASLWTSR